MARAKKILGTCSLCKGPVVKQDGIPTCQACGARAAQDYGPMIEMVNIPKNPRATARTAPRVADADLSLDEDIKFAEVDPDEPKEALLTPVEETPAKKAVSLKPKKPLPPILIDTVGPDGTPGKMLNPHYGGVSKR